MNSPTMNERAQHILKVLIDRYISEGQPVGSRTLAQESSVDLSSATIRNVMSDLEDLGLVKSPHTSSGRIPTDQGYRVFVDSLLPIQPLRTSVIKQLNERLMADSSELDPNELLQAASSMLSGITKMAGIVTIPRHDYTSLSQIEFLPLTDNRVLVILVINDHEIQNRIIHTTRSYSRSELQQAANYFNEQFRGQELSVVKKEILKDLRATKDRVDQMMLAAIELASRALNMDNSEGDFVLAGETNLLKNKDITEVGELSQLFDAFNQKQDILHLLDQAIKAQGVQLFIGEESGYQPLVNCSIVSSRYSVDDEFVGVLAVIGPTRMAYDHIIPIVDITAKLLGAALKSQ